MPLFRFPRCVLKRKRCSFKGGSEARETNKILAQIITEATEEVGIPPNWIKLLETRADVNEMLKMDKYIDLIIPRGSNEFVRYIMDNSRIPVMGHADGICHCYIDEDADIDMAIRIVVDSKTQYVAVCNATETLLVHKNIAPKVLPELKRALDSKMWNWWAAVKHRRLYLLPRQRKRTGGQSILTTSCLLK